MGNKNQPEVVGALRRLHLGPGDHPSGSPQSVHAGNEAKEDTRWTTENKTGPTLVYHGTFLEAGEVIKNDGLRRGDEWNGRPQSVYFTTRLNDAKTYARMFGGKYSHAIVEFEIPDDADTSVIFDEADTSLGLRNSFRIESDIPVTWIKTIRTFNYKITGVNEWEEVEPIFVRESIVPQKGYVVIIIKDNLVKRAIMPDHEIDIDEISYDWVSGLKDSGIHTVPIEPKDGIIAMPRARVEPKEEEVEKKSLLQEVRRSLGGLMEALAEQYSDVARHGDHIGQEGRKGQGAKGGSEPGFTHAEGSIPDESDDPSKRNPNEILKNEGMEAALETIKSSIVKAAQKVYDEWEQDEEGLDPELGSGGICDQIAGEIGGVVVNEFADVGIIDGGAPGDDHAWIIVYNDKEAWGVDIPSHIYEIGGGFSWDKIEGVTISPNDVQIWSIEHSDLEFVEGIDEDVYLSERISPWGVLLMPSFHSKPEKETDKTGPSKKGIINNDNNEDQSE